MIIDDHRLHGDNIFFAIKKQARYTRAKYIRRNNNLHIYKYINDQSKRPFSSLLDRGE